MFVVSFCRLKSEYKYDDSYTNIGILFSPTVDIPKPEGLTVAITITTQLVREPITFTVDGELLSLSNPVMGTVGISRQPTAPGAKSWV